MSICLRRREFIAGLGGAAAWPLAARGQQGDRVRRIGYLSPLGENDPEAKTFVSAFTQALAALGWTRQVAPQRPINGRRRAPSRLSATPTVRACEWLPPDVGPLPQLPFGAVHAVDAADSPGRHSGFRNRPALAVEEEGATEGEAHGSRPGGNRLMPQIAAGPEKTGRGHPRLITASGAPGP
jgi:hypothetical protein